MIMKKTFAKRKSDEEIIREMELCKKRMEEIRNGRDLDTLSFSDLINWLEVKSEHQALYWVMS